MESWPSVAFVETTAARRAWVADFEPVLIVRGPVDPLADSSSAADTGGEILS